MNAIMYMVKTGCQWRMLPKVMKPYIDIVDSIKAQAMTKFNNLL